MDVLAEITSHEADYRRSLNAAARALALNIIDPAAFFVQMTSTVSRGLTRAWHDGAKACGIDPQELTVAELSKMQKEINANLLRIYPLADYISQVRDPTGKVALNKAIRSRLELWLNAYDKVRTQARGMACKDKKAKWFLGKTEEHCTTCLRFEGRVYRWSTWQANQALPKSSLLCCGGWRCDCRLEDTTDRMTPGPFPASALCK